MDMSNLINKVKLNLILNTDKDDELIKEFITSAISYAESYQKKPEGYYSENLMPPTTERAVISCHLTFTKAEMAVQVAFLLTT